MTATLLAWWQQLRTRLIDVDVDDALTREHARNAAARAQLAAARVQYSEDEAAATAAARAAEAEVRAQRGAYAAQAAPLLAVFDDLALAQHHYEELSSTLSQQRAVVAQLRERELDHYGYVSKKMTSVALHVEALRACVRHGDVPFARELDALVADADSDDVAAVAAPLRPFAAHGVATPSAVRGAADALARVLADVGTTPAADPSYSAAASSSSSSSSSGTAPRSWLDWLRFAPAYSPAEVREARVRSRRTAQQFCDAVDAGEYAAALNVAAAAYATATQSRDAAAVPLAHAYDAFRAAVVPVVAARNLLAYAQASLDASRFACVERMLTE